MILGESIRSYAKMKSVSHRFDTPLVILQVEVDRNDYKTKLIMVWVLNKERPCSPIYLGYNSNFWVRGQPWESYESSEFQPDWPRS